MYDGYAYPSIQNVPYEIHCHYQENDCYEKDSDITLDTTWKEATSIMATNAYSQHRLLNTTMKKDSLDVQPQSTGISSKESTKISSPSYFSSSSRHLYNQRFQYHHRRNYHHQQEQYNQRKQLEPKQIKAQEVIEVVQEDAKEEFEKIHSDFPFDESQTAWVAFQSNGSMWETCCTTSVEMDHRPCESSHPKNILHVSPCKKSTAAAAATTTTTTTTTSSIGTSMLTIPREDHDQDTNTSIDANKRVSMGRLSMGRLSMGSTSVTSSHHIRPKEIDTLAAMGIFMCYIPKDGEDEADDQILMSGYPGDCYNDENLPSDQQRRLRMYQGQRRRIQVVPRAVLSKIGCHQHGSTATARTTLRKKQPKYVNSITSSSSLQTKLEAIKHQLITKPVRVLSKPILASFGAAKERIPSLHNPFSCCMRVGSKENNEDGGTMLIVEEISSDTTHYIPPPASSIRTTLTASDIRGVSVQKMEASLAKTAPPRGSVVANQT